MKNNERYETGFSKEKFTNSKALLNHIRHLIEFRLDIFTETYFILHLSSDSSQILGIEKFSSSTDWFNAQYIFSDISNTPIELKNHIIIGHEEGSISCKLSLFDKKVTSYFLVQTKAWVVGEFLRTHDKFGESHLNAFFNSRDKVTQSLSGLANFDS